MIKLSQINPIENNAYSVKHRKVDIEVGDSKVAGFKPRFKLKRWGGECSLDIDFAPDILEEEEIEEETDIEGNITKIKYKAKADGYEIEFEYYPVEPREEILIVNGEEHRFLQNELGGFEWEFILKEKPASNKFSFPIQTEGLKFYYQPPRHPNHPTWADKDGDGIPDTFGPGNVVGSYAVYHATRTNIHRSQADAEKYKAGKAFHIYRPKLTDAEGKEVWADLHIDEAKGVLTITLPQAFLNLAVYPVVVGPNFGYELIAAWDGTGVLNQMFGFRDTCPEAGIGVSITFYGKDNGENFKGVLVKQSDKTIIANGVTNSKNLLAGLAWRTAVFPIAPALSNIEYYICFIADNWITYRYEDGAVDGDEYLHDTTNSYASPTDPTDATLHDFKISIYCTYDAVAAGWTGTISGVTDPAEIAGVAVADIAEVKGVA